MRILRVGAEPDGPKLLAAAVCLALLGAAATAAEADLKLRVGAGLDSNPLALTDGEGASFAEASLAAWLGLRPGERARFRIRLLAERRQYESAFAAADSSRAALRASAAFEPWRNGVRRLAVLAGAGLHVRRSTFIDPETGGAFEYLGAPIPERLDASTAEGFVELRLRINRRVQLGLESGQERKDYVEDYRTIPGLDSIDYRARTLEPSLRLRLGGTTRLTLAWAATRRAYDEQPALDSMGNEVPGTNREYDYDSYSIALVLEPARSVDLKTGGRVSERRDRFAGYYDSQSASVWASIEKAFGERNRLRLYASRVELDYDHATVANDPNGEVRGLDASSASARYQRRLTAGIELFAELGARRVDNEDPILSHDRNWLMTGLLYRR